VWGFFRLSFAQRFLSFFLACFAIFNNKSFRESLARRGVPPRAVYMEWFVWTGLFRVVCLEFLSGVFYLEFFA
jgi:hypothetical protein